MGLGLPEADEITTAKVREVDYAAARPFWHRDIVIFGTYQELVKSLPAWTQRQ
jgi:hypothetical protein